MAGATEYEISLGSVAPAAAIADRLITELARNGVGAEVGHDGAIVVKAVSVAGLTAVASFLFRRTEKGLVLHAGGGNDFTLGLANGLEQVVVGEV